MTTATKPATHFIGFFHGQVKLKMKRNGCSKAAATKQVIKEQPAAHARYLAQWNALSPEQRRQLS